MQRRAPTRGRRASSARICVVVLVPLRASRERGANRCRAWCCRRPGPDAHTAAGLPPAGAARALTSRTAGRRSAARPRRLSRSTAAGARRRLRRHDPRRTTGTVATRATSSRVGAGAVTSAAPPSRPAAVAGTAAAAAAAVRRSARPSTRPRALATRVRALRLSAATLLGRLAGDGLHVRGDLADQLGHGGRRRVDALRLERRSRPCAAASSRRTSATVIMTVTTSPALPARAVRPERCRYALCSMGGSTWTTSSTLSTCTPRAATSVATSTRTSPAPNAARLRSRATCERLPCRSTDGMPDAVSCLASFLAWCLVRVNRMRRPVPDASFSTRSFLASAVSDLEDVVGHRVDVAVGLVDGVQHLVVQEALDELVHAVVERRREQQALAAGRRLVEDARDDGQEAQVGHVVGLVEHGDLDGVEGDEALLHQVFEAAGAGDDDVDAVLRARRPDAAARRRRRWWSTSGRTRRRAAGARPRSGWRARGSGRAPGRAGGPGGGVRRRACRRGARPSAGRRRSSCPSRSCRGRARRARRACRAGCPPGSGTARSCRRP